MSSIPPGNGEGPKKPRNDSEEESFINSFKNEADIQDWESPAQHAERLCGEVLKVLREEGIKSQSEAILLLAKLDLAIETSNNGQIKATAKEMQRDIKKRHPDLKKILDADI